MQLRACVIVVVWKGGMEIFWLISVVAGLAVWLNQRSQIARLSSRVAALEASFAPAQAAAPAVPPEAIIVAEPPKPAAVRAPVGSDLERRFGQRWLVWLGGLTLALGGVFIVQYSIEQELLGPLARLCLGLAISVILIAAAELLRKRPERLKLTALQTAGAAAALAAGGVAGSFGVAWAAFDLYGLISPFQTLAAMALCAGTALLLAWHHGPLLAVIGLAFGYLAPIMVANDVPDPAGLAAWLVVVQVLLAATLRFRPWPWLLALDLLGLVPLGVLLMLVSDDGIALAPMVALAASVLPVWLVRASEPSVRPRWQRILLGAAGLDGRAWIGALLVALTAVVASDEAMLAPWLLPVFALAFVLAALLGRAPLHVAWAAATAVMLVGALQDLPWQWTPPADVLGDRVTGTAGWLWLAPEYHTFGWYCALMACGFFLLGCLGALRTRRSGGFAALAVAVPLVLLVVAYGRIEAFTAAPRWTVVALVMAVLFLIAAERSARLGAVRAPAVAAFAVGVAGALALGLTMALELAWLTVALAAELLAMVLIHRRFALAAMARLAAILAGIVAARLLWQAGDLLPRGVIEANVGDAVWAYGAPTLILVGSYLAGGRLRPAWTRDVLALAATLAWIVTLMRVMAVWAGDQRYDDLLEPSLQVAALTLTAASLAMRPWSVPIQAAIALSALMALAQLVRTIGRVIGGETLQVIDVPVLNPLLLLLAVPAIGLASVIWRRGGDLARTAVRLAGALALVLVLAWPVAEIRRTFAGSVLWGDSAVLSAENWLYSAWLVLASLGLLAAGLRRRDRDLRLGAMAVLVLAILKVFLIDLDGLAGLWRAAAFLGLGIALVGVGLAYQRLFSDGERATPSPGQ